MPSTIRRPVLAAGLALGGFATLGAWLQPAVVFGQTPVAAPAFTATFDPVSFRDVVKKVLPAVVSVEARGVVRGNPNRALGLPPGLPPELRRFFPPAPNQADADPDEEVIPRRNGRREVEQNLGSGSGVIVDGAGFVLTNFHVVDGAEKVEVKLHDGRTFTSTDIRKDPKSDLAVVKIDAKDLPFLQFGDSDAVEVGDRVLAVGAPFGLAGTVTHGIVSAKARSLQINRDEDFLQTDAAINPGNSGGPLVTLDGKIVGLNSAIKSRSGGFQGIGLAVSSNLARDVVAQLSKGGSVKRGYLGVAIGEVDEEKAKEAGLDRPRGVLVGRVYADTPADKAGLKSGDVITAVNGAPVATAAALPKAVSRLPIGQKVKVDYVRAGKSASAEVTIEEQPADERKLRALTEE